MAALTVAQQVAKDHFGSRIVRALAKQGIRVIGLQSEAYVMDDNDTCRVWAYGEVLAAAGRVVELTKIEQRLVALVAA